MKLIEAMGGCPKDGYICRESKPKKKFKKAMPKFYEMPPTLCREDRMADDWGIHN